MNSKSKKIKKKETREDGDIEQVLEKALYISRRGVTNEWSDKKAWWKTNSI